jgi:hypothetical protein
MNKSQRMCWSRRGANLLLQVRCAVYNGTPGSGYGQKFHSANDTHPHPQAIAALPPNLPRSRRAIAGGAPKRARRRSTVAPETLTAAQTAAVMPLTGVNATTALVKARRHPAPSGSPTGRQVFLDDNDGFRTGEALREMRVILS